MVKLIYIIQKETYKGNDGKEHNYETFIIEDDKGNRANILPNYNYDKNTKLKLKMMADVKLDERK